VKLEGDNVGEHKMFAMLEPAGMWFGGLMWATCIVDEHEWYDKPTIQVQNVREETIRIKKGTVVAYLRRTPRAEYKTILMRDDLPQAYADHLQQRMDVETVTEEYMKHWTLTPGQQEDLARKQKHERERRVKKEAREVTAMAREAELVFETPEERARREEKRQRKKEKRKEGPKRKRSKKTKESLGLSVTFDTGEDRVIPEDDTEEGEEIKFTVTLPQKGRSPSSQPKRKAQQKTDGRSTKRSKENKYDIYNDDEEEPEWIYTATVEEVAKRAEEERTRGQVVQAMVHVRRQEAQMTGGAACPKGRLVPRGGLSRNPGREDGKSTHPASGSSQPHAGGGAQAE
jgi:hypothetical protein